MPIADQRKRTLGAAWKNTTKAEEEELIASIRARLGAPATTSITITSSRSATGPRPRPNSAAAASPATAAATARPRPNSAPGGEPLGGGPGSIRPIMPNGQSRSRSRSRSLVRGAWSRPNRGASWVPFVRGAGLREGPHQSPEPKANSMLLATFAKAPPRRPASAPPLGPAVQAREEAAVQAREAAVQAREAGAR